MFDFACLYSAKADTFGTDASYLPRLGGKFAVTGVVKSGRQMEEVTPGVIAVFEIAVSAFAKAPQNGDQVLIGSDSFDVVDVVRRATGEYRLALNKSK